MVARGSAVAERPLMSVDPTTGETIEEHPEHDEAEVESRLERSTRAAETWTKAPLRERIRVLEAASRLLRQRAHEHAQVMAREMGKPLPQGVAESGKCGAVCAWFAEHAEQMLRPRPVPPAPGASPAPLLEEIAFAPLGPVLAIMPWNFPFWQVFRFAAPALAAGNTVLLKHAESTQGCARAIEELLAAAGAPEGVFQNLAIRVGRVGDVIRHPAVKAVTFTGSPRGGRAVAEAAGAALKKVVLELGGSDPYVVLADADVERAARTCVAARLVNGGQTCVAAKRFIAVDSVRREFTADVVELMHKRTFGDPRSEPAPDLGPLARSDLRDTLHAQVTRSIQGGARNLLGGEVPPGPGYFYPPTVLADVRKGLPAFDEETFGPLAAIVPAADEDEAFRLANDSTYGLGAAIFTRDVERGQHLARERLDAGFCAVNDFVRSDPRQPFGGVKDSGFGRELSEFGLREFVNVKTVVVVSPS